MTVGTGWLYVGRGVRVRRASEFAHRLKETVNLIVYVVNLPGPLVKPSKRFRYFSERGMNSIDSLGAGGLYGIYSLGACGLYRINTPA